MSLLRRFVFSKAYDLATQIRCKISKYFAPQQIFCNIFSS